MIKKVLKYKGRKLLDSADSKNFAGKYIMIEDEQVAGEEPKVKFVSYRDFMLNVTEHCSECEQHNKKTT